MARQVGRTMIDFICGHCGAQAQRVKSLRREQMFCDQSCYLASDYHSETVKAANAARRTGVYATRPCGNCGIPVTRHTSRGTKNFFCSEDCRVIWQRRGETIQVRESGYALIFVGRDYPGAAKSGHILEHRKVMADMLGRPLTVDENVHHRNGVRNDNRPENLELWSSSQPKGQRVEDKIKWAREFLALYEKGVPNA